MVALVSGVWVDILGNSFLFSCSHYMHVPCFSTNRGEMGRKFAPPIGAGVSGYSPPTVKRRSGAGVLSSAAVSDSRVVAADGSPCSPTRATNFKYVFSVLHPGLIPAKKPTARQACEIASTADTSAPARVSIRTDSAAVAPVVTMSSTSTTSPVTGLMRRIRPGDVALTRGTEPGHRIAHPRSRAKRRHDAHSEQTDHRRCRDPADRVTATATARGTPGRRQHSRRRSTDDAPGQQVLQTGVQRSRPAAPRGPVRPFSLAATITRLRTPAWRPSAKTSRNPAAPPEKDRQKRRIDDIAARDLARVFELLPAKILAPASSRRHDDGERVVDLLAPRRQGFPEAAPAPTVAVRPSTRTGVCAPC